MTPDLETKTYKSHCMRNTQEVKAGTEEMVASASNREAGGKKVMVSAGEHTKGHSRIFTLMGLESSTVDGNRNQDLGWQE